MNGSVQQDIYLQNWGRKDVVIKFSSWEQNKA